MRRENRLDQRAVDLRSDGGMVGREKVFEEKPLERELLRELQRDPCLATEDEQVGEACSASKYKLIWEVLCECLYIQYTVCTICL